MAEQHLDRPAFARVYTRFAQTADARGGAEHRRVLLAGLSGAVIEVGAGGGANFAHYPETVTEVLAIEPERHLRTRAQRAAAQAPVSIEVIAGEASRLPVQSGAFDAGVVSLVLCTVPDQAQALAEIFRAIRPGGELRFYEHVISQRPWEARLQRLADATFWPHAAGGCHLTRDTIASIQRAGFTIETCERFAFAPTPLLPMAPHILGRARRPA